MHRTDSCIRDTNIILCHKYYFMLQSHRSRSPQAQLLNLPVWNKLEDRCSLSHLTSPWDAVSVSMCAFQCVPYFPQGSHNNPASKHEIQPPFAWSPSSKSVLDSLTVSPYKTKKFSLCFPKGFSRYSFFFFFGVSFILLTYKLLHGLQKSA